MKKNLFILIFTLYIFSNSFAQSTWNLKYLPLNSLDKSFLKKEIRLDFKGQENHEIGITENSQDIIPLLHAKDTIQLFINQKKFDFVENWSIYDYHGVLQQQTLLYTENKYHSGRIQIKEMTLKDIHKNDLVVKCKLYFYSSRGVLRKTEEQEISINKSFIKGFLISIDE